MTLPPICGGLVEAFDALNAHSDAQHSALASSAQSTPLASTSSEAERRRPAPRRSQATELVDLAHANDVELWHTPSGDTFATITVEDHREHHPLRRVVRDYLARVYYAQHHRSASSAALTDALATLHGQAKYDGAEHPASVRFAAHGDALYLDLGDSMWTTIAIDADGWGPVTQPPVHHWRPSSLRPLPFPAAGGTLDALRTLWPALDDESWTLVASWLVATLAPSGPYPILVETGEQGAGKSTLGRMLRNLVDPASPALRGVPRDERDVMIGALTSHIVALDNLSGLPVWLSDALCRIATGGGLATRSLYTDLDETLIDVTRPILLTGIGSPATRGDLLDRALVVTLPALTDESRADEAGLWGRYAALQPTLLGAVLDAASCALRERATVRLARRPRMADACTWVTAAESALGWPTHTTATAWLGAREAASADLLATDPVGQAVLALDLPWRGTASDLLELLSARVSERTRLGKTWPASARNMADILRRLAPDLRRAGVEMTYRRRGHSRSKTWTIVRSVHMDPDPGDLARHYCADRADDVADDKPAHRPQSSASSAVPSAGSVDFQPFSAPADDADDVSHTLSCVGRADSRGPERVRDDGFVID